MDGAKLKYFMYKKKISGVALAKASGMGVTTFWRKVTGKTLFKQDEIAKIAGVLSLSPENIVDIFFAKEIAKTQNEKGS